MQPYVVVDYHCQSIKVLLVAESHYLPRDSQVRSAEEWYESSQASLSASELEYITTNDVVKLNLHKTKSIFYLLNDALMEIGLSFNDVAFMNCFQRPAASGETFRKIVDSSGIDTKIAKQTIANVISDISPDKIIFVSKMAWDFVGEHLAKEFKKKKISVDISPDWTRW